MPAKPAAQNSADVQTPQGVVDNVDIPIHLQPSIFREVENLAYRYHYLSPCLQTIDIVYGSNGETRRQGSRFLSASANRPPSRSTLRRETGPVPLDATPSPESD